MLSPPPENDSAARRRRRERHDRGGSRPGRRRIAVGGRDDLRAAERAVGLPQHVISGGVLADEIGETVAADQRAGETKPP